MNAEILIGLISSLIGGMVVALITHWSTRKRTEAEAKKLEAEAEKTKAETTKLLIEIDVQKEKTTSQEPPAGWGVFGDYADDYEIGVDYSVAYSGRASGCIKSRANPRGYVTLMQSFKADNYLGKRLRLSGFVKVQDVKSYAGLWMRVDGPKDTSSKRNILGFDNMVDRPIKGTTDWRKYYVVLDVPENSILIAFGIGMSGPGQVWLDEIQFELVGNDVPTTNLQESTSLPTRPINLDFEMNK
jgi:hypothetical protein